MSEDWYLSQTVKRLSSPFIFVVGTVKNVRHVNFQNFRRNEIDAMLLKKSNFSFTNNKIEQN